MAKNKNETTHQPTQPVVAPSTTVGEQIWNEIKNKDILMFALPGQIVANYCSPVTIDPSRCFLLYKVSAVIPALEEAVGSKYTCEVADKYIIVSRKNNAF